MNNLRITLTLLRESLLEKNLKAISIAKSPYIENVAWQDFLELVKDIFRSSPIKVLVCKGSLQYVMGSKRDEIFRKLHNLPIGDHRGASKTYNRIRQDHYWKNLEQDIQLKGVFYLVGSKN